MGSRVRIEATGMEPVPLFGTVVAFDSAAMILAVRNRATPIVVDRTRIIRVDVSRGRVGNAKKGALLGVIPWLVLIGLVVNSGGVAGSGIFEPQSFALLGASVGTGALIGRSVKTEHWSPISRAGSR